MKYISILNPEDTSAIEALLNEFQRHWNDKEATKMSALFTENAEFTDIMGQVAIGRGKIEAMHRAVFGRFMKNAVLEQRILYAREIAEHTVMVSCKWKTSGHSNPKDEPLPDRQGLMQVIATDQAGTWQISLVLNSDFTHLYNNIESYEMKFFEGRP